MTLLYLHKQLTRLYNRAFIYMWWYRCCIQYKQKNESHCCYGNPNVTELIIWPFRTWSPLKGYTDGSVWWCFEREKVSGVTETARLRPAPETRCQTFPYSRAHQNVARVAGKNSGCSEGHLRSNFPSIRRSGQLSTWNDCSERQ